MLSCIPLSLFLLVSPALAGTPGSFDQVIPDTLVSAMMMFVGNEDKVYIVDKAQGNAAPINGHPAWGSVWDVNTGQMTVMDIQTNTFCSSGAHLPNGSFVQFGGNTAVAIGGGNSSEGPGIWDQTLEDFDGSRAIRILNPCKSTDDFSSTACQWYDDPANGPKMQAQRWYSTAESLANGTITLIGGFQLGGYILRTPINDDPTVMASLNYEFFPSNNVPPQNLQFLFKTSGLNSYPHAFLMASGKMFLQANVSTTLWDYNANTEEDLPDMPNNVVRVYPGSGATAMLPMTPANNYSQTIIFCGGADLTEAEWGSFDGPTVPVWEYPASNDCQRITPEPQDGSPAAYVQDDPMPEGRTMGQFIILADGKLLVVNGGQNGTAGYGQKVPGLPALGIPPVTPDQKPFGESYACEPVGTPAMYDPNAKSGQRWSRPNFDTSSIARLYHSSALLMADGSVLIAGSNPNFDVNLTGVDFPTTYIGEKFYPPYFSASTRPSPSGVPTSLSYGGSPFDITVPASSYSGDANTAAENTAVNVIRPGWTTHGMNMGQRFLQLQNTYTVNKDGSITLHVAQMPPNPNIFQPGPAFVFVVVNGIPSNGTHVIIGSGNIEAQPVSAAAELPASVQQDANGSANSSSTGSAPTNKSWISSHIGLVAGVGGGAVAVALAAIAVGICLARRRRARIRSSIAAGKARNEMLAAGGSPSSPYPFQGARAMQGSTDSRVFLAPQAHRSSAAWSQQGSEVWDPYADAAYRDHATPVQDGYYRDSGAAYPHYDGSQHQHSQEHFHS